MNILRIFIGLILLPLLVLGQKGRPQRVVVCAGAGTATAATCAPSPTLSSLAELLTTPRMQIHFTPTASSTGALTLAVNGLAATAVVKYVGGAAQPLIANDVRSGTSYILEYDGTNFVVKSLLGNGGGSGGLSGNETTAAAAFPAANKLIASAGADRSLKDVPITVDGVTGELTVGSGGFEIGGEPQTASGMTSPSGTKIKCTFDSANSNRISCKNAAGTVSRYVAVNDLPDCSNATTSKLLFNTSTLAFTCGADQSGSGGGGAVCSLGADETISAAGDFPTATCSVTGLTAGKIIRMKANGLANNASDVSQGFFAMKLNGTAVTPQIIAGANGTGCKWILEIAAEVETAGASGTIDAVGTMALQATPAGTFVWKQERQTGTVVNTTGTVTVRLAAIPNGASPSLVMTHMKVWVE